MKKNLSLLFIFLFLSLCVYAYVGETFTYEGVQYRIIYEDAATGVYQVGINHYDTASIIVPDFVTYRGKAYQVAQTAPFLPDYCALQHYTKVDFSQLQYDFSPLLNPYTHSLNMQLYYIDNVVVDTLLLPPYTGQLMFGLNPFAQNIDSYSCDTMIPGIRHLIIGDRMPAYLAFIGGEFPSALQRLDVSAYPYTNFSQFLNGDGFSHDACNLRDFPFLDTVILPQTITSFPCGLTIGDRSLNYITIPDSLESIEINAFGDIAMENLRLGRKVRTLEAGWASEWRSLKHIEVDTQNPYFSSDESGCLLSKRGNVFHRYPVGRPDESYRLPYSIDTIGPSAFSLYTTYRHQSNGYNASRIGSGSSGCCAGSMASLCLLSIDEWPETVALREVQIHSGVQTIQFQAFMGSSIRQIKAVEGRVADFSLSAVRDIQRQAFAHSLLDSISLPATLRYLGSEYTEWHRHQIGGTSCPAIGTDSGYQIYCDGEVFLGCQHLQKVNFDKAVNLDFIGTSCFAFCTSLERLDLLPCVKVRDIYPAICWQDSALTYVALPRGVETIGTYAFHSCVSLQKIVCPAAIPIPIDSSVFEGVNKQTCELSVPAASIPLYQNAPVWREFFNITSNGMTAIAVTSNDSAMGIVHGGGGYDLGDNITLTAVPNEGYEFVGWSDGSTDNPRTVTVTQDSNIVANFQYIEYHINAYPNDSTLGYVTGGGFYHLHDTVTLWAHPYDNGKFIEWSDGYRFSYREGIIVTRDTTIIAIFEQYIDTTHTDTTVVRYTLTAIPNDSAMGAVTGSGLYEAGEEAYLTAIPFDGYRFRDWDFSFTTELSVVFIMPPRNTTVVATFEPVNDALPGTRTDDASEDSDNTPYNILGQRVDDTYHGIVIRNGKKMLQ